MKIISIDEDGRFGEAVLSGNTLRVNLRLVSADVGDYVLVHAGCAVEKIQKERAEEIMEIFSMLEDVGNEP